MIQQHLNFVCLDPRKTKRAKMLAFVQHGGRTRWLKLALWRWPRQPRAWDVADQALKRAKCVPKSQSVRWAKRWFLAGQYAAHSNGCVSGTRAQDFPVGRHEHIAHVDGTEW